MPFRSEKQRRYLWANEPKIAREWTEEYGSKPVKAKKGKYQEFKHPDHNIKSLEHMEDNVSSKERVEKLLDDRKSKRETKEKLVKAAEGELVRQKTRGTGAAVTGIQHYTMKGMPTAYQGQLIQTPTRGTGAAVSGTDHYIMPGMDAAKTGKLIKAKDSKYITKRKHYLTKKPIGERESEFEYKKTHQPKETKWITKRQAGGPIKAKKGQDIYDVKKISKSTSKRLFSLYKHREVGGYKEAKDYKKYLKNLKGMTAKPSTFLERRKQLAAFPAVKSKSFYFKDTPPASKLSTVLKKVGKRTGIGKALLAGTAVAGAYEAGKRKIFDRKNLEKNAKDWFNVKDKKKKVDKKSIGGETVVMKSGGGYIDDLI